MELRKEYFLEHGMPCNENGMFYEAYVDWLENRLVGLQNTSSNLNYAKCYDCGQEFEIEKGICKECSDFGDGCGS